MAEDDTETKSDSKEETATESTAEPEPKKEWIKYDVCSEIR